MKTKSFLSILLLIVFGTFSSCDLLDKAKDISFEATIPLNFSINETAVSSTGKAYSDTKLLDAKADAEVAKYASKIKEFRQNVVIIAQTAYGLMDEKEKIMNSGFDDYLIKPIISQILIDKLKSNLERKQ